jgi:hypothetical protein
VDGAAIYHTFRDPQSSKVDRAVEIGELTANALALVGAMLASLHLDHAATTIH